MDKILKKATNKPLKEVDIEPGKQPNLFLGKFSSEKPPVGFAIHLTPDPQEDAIATHVARVNDSEGSYELVLHIANFGTETIHAEVWKM